MSITINIHPSLAHITGGHEKVPARGENVGQCLDSLVQQYPEMREWLYNKHGELSSVIEVYVNGESSYPEDLEMPVKDGDELHVVAIIIGG